MEVPAVTDPTLSGLDTDRRRLSLREEGFDCVDDITQNEERALEKIEEDATSLMALNSEFADETGETIQKEEKTLEELIIEDMKIQEDAITLGENGSDFAGDVALKEDKALEKVEEDATSLKEAESDFANETVLKVEADETSRKEENGDTSLKEENTPEKLGSGKDVENKDDAVSLREDGSDCAENVAQKEEKAPEKIEEDVTSMRAAESDFANGNSHEEETDDSDKEEKTPEKPIIEDLRIQEDATSLRAERSDCADDTANGEETAPENIQEYATSLGGEGSEGETNENAKTENKILEKSTVEMDEKIEDDAASLREDDSGCADDLVKEDEKASQEIKEGSTSFRAESSGFADEAAQKEENISDGAVSLRADDSDRVDDTAQPEDSSPVKSTVEKDENIQDDTTGLRGEGSGCADDDTANEEEKASLDIQERSIRFPAESSDFAYETAHKEENNSEKSIAEDDEKIQDGATSLRTNGSDCADDIAQAEEKSPVKSTAKQIQEDATSLRVQSTDFPDETAHEEKTDENSLKEEKNPEKLISEKDQKIEDVAVSLRAREQDKTPTTELVQEDATSLRVPNSEFVDETAREVSDNNTVVEEPEKKEQNTRKESSQAKTEPDNQPAPRLASTTTNPGSSAAAPSTVHPAGLGRAARLLEPTPRSVQQPRVNGTTSQTQTQQIEDSNGEAEEYDETREQLQMIRVKFLRLAHRLGQTPHNVVVAQVLYRLGLAEQLRGRNGGRVGAFSFDRASAMAVQLEAAGQEPLDFSCTIMVLGKTGVGKSATINSIFDEQKFSTDAFQMGTQKVQDVVGTVQGIKVRVIDTPGLLSSWSDQRHNVKILRAVKQFIKKTPPDIVLYLDRLDMQSRDFGDMPLLRTITDTFGPSIWFNAIVVLTHAASAPPDGPNGTASSYDVFVTQRSHVVQQSIRQAAGDMRLMNPVSLVENHSACRTNRAGQRVLPNGQVWKPHLLLLSFASKILAEANTLLKLQDSPPGKPSTTRSRAPPLPFLLSSLLQSRPQLKLPAEQALGDEDDDLDGSSDSDNEAEYDDLPPFTRLTKAQVAMLTKAQKKAYFDELAYREKLVMKKQLKEEKRRRKILKELAASGQGLPNENSENPEEESDTAIPAAPMPDLALPASFDSSNPTHRYRCLDSASQWIVRPVLDTHGWDRDVGYEGINVERFFVVKNKLPVSFSGQASKDKKDANVQMEINSSLSHGEGKSTSMGFDLQTVGKDMAYTLRGETKFCNHRRNKATAGLSATILGDAFSTGLKLEDKLIINKCFRMVMAGGAMTGRGDVAYGGSLEAQWRDKDYPIGRFLSTLGLSIMDWHGDLAIGGNIQTQVPIGHSTNLIARANLNNRGAGQMSIRLSSSEQLQIALVGLVPLLRKVADQFLQLQYGQQ